jgi:carboxyl-terminal processing protease
MSQVARVYLDAAIAAMRDHSMNRASVDWDEVEDLAFRIASGAQTEAATYRAISESLGDDHSVFLSPTEAGSFSGAPAEFVTPEIGVRTGRLGYVMVGRYLGDIGDQADAYANDVASQISQTNDDVCGWILDLRTNTGGNMWPMLGGLAPLLDLGPVGGFTYPDGTVELWENDGSALLWDDVVMADNLAQPGSPRRVKPIAVLISAHTASSGEAVAVAFHGQDGVLFFGQPTRGLTTSNEPIELSDGAIIVLTMSNFTDRHANQYGQDISVEPDEATPTHEESERSAIDWLLLHPNCAG